MNIYLDKNTEYIINSLEASGFEAYAVGGCVRDSVLGREVTDYDITTSALPREIKAVFNNETVVETGIKHGTITVIIDRKPYEVTTFRVEREYSDGRHPDTVTFVSDLMSDLSRRDFTMNAVAYSHKKGIIDPFGGIKDIKAKTIRTVGDPSKRFSEDRLRILRALRFSSTLGFELEEATREAVFELSKGLVSVSSERVYAELKKLVSGKSAASVIESYKSVLSEIIDIQGDLSKLELLPEDFPMRFSCVCGNSVVESLSHLRSDNETKRLCALFSSSEPIPKDRYLLKKYISALGRENALAVVKYRRAVFGEDLNLVAERIINSDECLFIKDLDINGNDIIALGITGKNVGEMLGLLLDSVLKDEIENKKEVLLMKAKDIDNLLI